MKDPTLLLQPVLLNDPDPTPTRPDADFTNAFTPNGVYLHDPRFYYHYFGKLPNVLAIDNVALADAGAWFRENYRAQIKQFYFFRDADTRHDKTHFREQFYILHDDTMVAFNDGDCCRVMHYDAKHACFEQLGGQIRKFKKKRKRVQREISLITQGMHGLELTSLAIKPTRLDVSTHYNDDFGPVHQVILQRLAKPSDKGIVLLHGLPGTGKTTYLRYLIGKIKKQMLFVPPNIAANIANPDFINVLIDNPNAILVIEDAENIVMDRAQTGSSAVSTLLNLSDGLLSDCLNMQIICSFNTPLSSVDTALLRKGRLIAKYEFKKLPVGKAQSLSDALGFGATISQEMTLSDIYNQAEMTFEKAAPRIGFQAS